MLRHYEKLGLQTSDRREDYGVYRPEEVLRLRQILLLRKLRLPLKEIGEILHNARQPLVSTVLMCYTTKKRK